MICSRDCAECIRNLEGDNIKWEKKMLSGIASRQLNIEVLNRLQRSGEALVSNAVIGGAFLLRACVVNFRTSLVDIEALPGIVIRIGREVDAAMRSAELQGD